MYNINHKYEIFKQYDIHYIFDTIKNNALPDKIIYHPKDYEDSLRRIKIIKHLIERDGLCCKKCNQVPQYFALGKDKINRWHLDLYCFFNDHFMFTIDHIYPKSYGGSDTLDNYQLLCKPCNELKSDKIDNDINYNIKDIKDIKDNNKNDNYFNNKFNSLSQQIRGIFNKIKKHKIINIKEYSNLTIGKEYYIKDIKLHIDNSLNIKYYFLICNDLNENVIIPYNYFITTNNNNQC